MNFVANRTVSAPVSRSILKMIFFHFCNCLFTQAEEYSGELNSLIFCLPRVRILLFGRNGLFGSTSIGDLAKNSTNPTSFRRPLMTILACVKGTVLRGVQTKYLKLFWLKIYTFATGVNWHRWCTLSCQKLPVLQRSVVDRDILWIRIRGSVPLTYGSGSCFFLSLQDEKSKRIHKIVKSMHK